MSVVMLADGAFTLSDDVAGRVASVKVPTAAHPGRRPLLSGEVAAFFGVTPVAAEFEEVEDAVTAAPRRPRVDVPNVPGGDSLYLKLKGLWNDPGSGRFVKRGRSTAKAQAMMFVPGDAVREVARGRGRVRARVADNRMSRSGITKGDVIEVGFKDDEFGVVEVLSASGKKRKYDVKWARFDEVVEDTTDAETPGVLAVVPINEGWDIYKEQDEQLLRSEVTGPAGSKVRQADDEFLPLNMSQSIDNGQPLGVQRNRVNQIVAGINAGAAPGDDSERRDREIVSTVAQATQDGLREQGITHVVLYRGVEGKDSDPFSPDSTGKKGWVSEYGASSGVTSWTTDPRAAADYGTHVVKALVPVDQVLSWDVFGVLARGKDGKGGYGREVLVVSDPAVVQRVVDVFDQVEADTPDVPEVPAPSRVGRGMTLDLPYEQAQPFIDGTATVDDVMRLVDDDEGIGLWWGELGDTFDLSDLQDYADDGGGYPNEEGPNSNWMREYENDGTLSVVFLADKPEGWSADDNPDMTGGFSAYGFAGSENSWIDPDKFGSSLRLRAIQYRAGDGKWATIDVPDERRVPIAPPVEADTPDVVDSVRAQEADILQIALDDGNYDFPDCLVASEEINKRFGLPVEQGFFYGSEPGAAYNKRNWGPHAWVRLPDGSILDLTSDQFSAGAGPGTQVIRPGDPSFGRYWTEGKGMWETRSPEDALGWLQAGGVDVVEAPPRVRGTASRMWFDGTIGSQPWYHVTGFDRAAAILANGLDPSYGGLQSDATAPPRPGAVYLAHKTMVDAGLAGNPLAELLDIDRPVTLEFDTSGLDYRRVVPDEDYFTIAEWEKPEAYGLPAWDPTVETSGAWAQRVGLGEQPGIVEKVVGQDNRFAYGGPVPAAAIKRVRFDAYFDDNGTLVPASDWLTPEEARRLLQGETPELPQDVYDIAGPEVIDALTGAGVTVVAVAPTGVGAL
jgi:hypothetical protein